MQADTIEITTPSGYKVTIKSFLTFGERRQIQRVYAKYSHYDQTGTPIMSGEGVYEAGDLAVSLLVKRILDPQSNDITGKNPLQTILSFRDELDARAIYTAIDDIRNPAEPTEDETKKFNSTS